MFREQRLTLQSHQTLLNATGFLFFFFSFFLPKLVFIPAGGTCLFEQEGQGMGFGAAPVPP